MTIFHLKLDNILFYKNYNYLYKKNNYLFMNEFTFF